MGNYPPESRPFPFAPLEALVHTNGMSATDVGDVLNVDRRSVLRYRTQGLSARVADVLANRIGVHPAFIWRDWNREGLDDVFCRYCGAELDLESHPGKPRHFCNPECRKNMRRAAPKPCPGCGIEISGDAKRCPPCAAQGRRDHDARGWQRRKERIAGNPLTATLFDQEGRVRWATDVRPTNDVL